MRWATCLMVLAAACGGPSAMPGSDAAPPPVDAGVDAPTAFALVRMEPSQVPFRGADVTIYFKGTPPASITCPPGTGCQYSGLSIQVNATTGQPTCGGDPEVSPPCPASAWTFHVPHSSGGVNAEIGVVARDVHGEIGRLVPAGAYLPPVPATPKLVVQSWTDSSGLDGFDLPLAPELSRACARRDVALLENVGDLPLDVTSLSITGDAAFTIDRDACSGTELGPWGTPGPSGSPANECGAVDLCFTSTSPGAHAASLAAATSAGPVTASLTATVIAPSTGLDTTFTATGVLPTPLVSHVMSTTLPPRPSMTPAALMGDGVAVESGGLTRVHPDGTTTTWGSAASTWAIASSWDHASVYCANDSVTQHYTDAGQDTSFGTAGNAPVGISTIVGAINLGALGQAPSGNLIIDEYAFNLYGLTAAGAYDTAFGAGGDLGLAADASMTIDSQGRLYVGLRTCSDATHCTYSLERRSTVDGSLDASFAYAASGILALDAQDHLYVATDGGAVVRLDATGNPTAVALAWPAGLADKIYDFTLDPAGRLVFAHGTDRVLRFLPDGTFDRQLGMSGALRVLCPTTGGCWEVGRGAAQSDGFVARLVP